MVCTSLSGIIQGLIFLFYLGLFIYVFLYKMLSNIRSLIFAKHMTAHAFILKVESNAVA